ncbi:hypothetical protein [Streptomyces sp. B6B3]|uniref:hypothetical protein n=1 Tax=Streptomyces sp. B6B3 TaxID=3153570 RepID=UPI00325E7401
MSGPPGGLEADQRPPSDFQYGEVLMYCYGDAVDAASWLFFDDRLKTDCDMGDGSSGGPFLVDDEGITIAGANSHTDGDAPHARNVRR